MKEIETVDTNWTQTRVLALLYAEVLLETSKRLGEEYKALNHFNPFNWAKGQRNLNQRTKLLDDVDAILVFIKWVKAGDFSIANRLPEKMTHLKNYIPNA